MPQNQSDIKAIRDAAGTGRINRDEYSKMGIQIPDDAAPSATEKPVSAQTLNRIGIVKKAAGRINANQANALWGSKVPAFKKGGKVKKTGLIRAHKGETVMTAKQTKNLKADKAGSSCKRVTAKR